MGSLPEEEGVEGERLGAGIGALWGGDRSPGDGVLSPTATSVSGGRLRA